MNYLIRLEAGTDRVVHHDKLKKYEGMSKPKCMSKIFRDSARGNYNQVTGHGLVKTNVMSRKYFQILRAFYKMPDIFLPRGRAYRCIPCGYTENNSGVKKCFEVVSEVQAAFTEEVEDWRVLPMDNTTVPSTSQESSDRPIARIIL